ncbi:MAG: DNA-binding XRE family transcriptional regulator [Gammaproteobacteria bacterium]|jgi:DNA-binding XRE family transcriptional regulator
MNKVQFIEKDGQRQFAVVPVDDYERMLAAFEDAHDVSAADIAKARNEENFPSEIVDRLLDGENAIRVFREHRGMTQAQLAELAGITPGYLSQIETGAKEGKVSVLSRIARALTLMVDDIIVA